MVIFGFVLFCLGCFVGFSGFGGRCVLGGSLTFWVVFVVGFGVLNCWLILNANLPVSDFEISSLVCCGNCDFDGF